MDEKKRTRSVDPVIITVLCVILVALIFTMLLFRPDPATLMIDPNAGLWPQLVIAFITGVTTGGLSCLAVQGGLLASSLAHQIEQNVVENSAKTKPRMNTALPIMLFLIAKLITYTLLGVLLGWVGSYFTFNPLSRAALMIVIGVFMIGNALRMFNAHPIFRYFSIEPPKFITRYIRRTARGTDVFTPLFLGALTVFIPCGITQAMMATALASGSMLVGAALMFAFTLGTSPVFFLIAYLTTELGASLEKFFMRFVAVVLLILGFVTLDGGLNLMGSPLSFQNLSRRLFQRDEPIVAAQPFLSEGEITVQVKNEGYFPAVLKAPAGAALTLNLVTQETYSCALAFLIPSMDYYQVLPSTGVTKVDIPPQQAGTELFYTCSMGMYTGQIVFE
jgi:sulfite exporter TauE/SafE